MRTLLNNYDYGSANLPMRDSSFLSNLNTYKPADYPQFSNADVLASNTGVQEKWVQFVNQASRLCMDITNVAMENYTNVMLYTCNGGAWQYWFLDASTGMIHSKQDPRFCLDNSSSFENGANIMIYRCWGGDSQRFYESETGYFAVMAAPDQVIDAYGVSEGSNIGTWWNGGGENQRWWLIE